MTIPRNLAWKDGLVYVPKHSRRMRLRKDLLNLQKEKKQ